MAARWLSCTKSNFFAISGVTFLPKKKQAHDSNRDERNAKVFANRRVCHTCLVLIFEKLENLDAPRLVNNNKKGILYFHF